MPAIDRQSLSVIDLASREMVARDSPNAKGGNRSAFFIVGIRIRSFQFLLSFLP